MRALALNVPDRIINGYFSVSDPASDQYGWSTLGAASVTGGTGVLTEHESFTSRFSQTFTIPAGATGLRFTIQSLTFGDDPSGPPDAFEVALLDAHTGQSVLGTAQGLALTDALLNIQASGQTFVGSAVTVPGLGSSGDTLPWNAPVTVQIDLTGVTAGTTATLYFDLLGFGARNSTVIIDNVCAAGRRAVRRVCSSTRRSTQARRGMA